MNYIQVAFGKGDGCILEYQDGSIENHFQSIRTDFSLKDVSEVFCAFSNGDNSWKSNLQWRSLEIKPKADLLKQFSTSCFVLFLLFSIPIFFGLEDNERIKFLNIDLMTYMTLWSYLMLLSSLSDLKNLKQVHGRMKAYAIGSVFLALICTVIQLVMIAKSFII